MISVTQGPRNNAGLGALNYDKTFEAGAEGARAKYRAGEQKNQAVNDAFAKMQETYKLNEITGAKVQAAIQQNPALFQGLEGGTDATSKAFAALQNGTANPTHVAMLSAYVDAANTQQTQALQAKNLQSQEKERMILEEVNRYNAEVFTQAVENAEAENREVTAADYQSVGYNVAKQIVDPTVKNEFISSLFDFTDRIAQSEKITGDTADIQNFKFTKEQYETVHDLIQKGNMVEAKRVLRALGVKLEYKSSTFTDELTNVSDEELRARFGPAVDSQGGDTEVPSIITYEYKGRPVGTTVSYASGNEPVEKIKSNAKGANKIIQKVTQSKFETYTREDQKKYLEKYGEEFKEDEAAQLTDAELEASVFE